MWISLGILKRASMKNVVWTATGGQYGLQIFFTKHVYMYLFTKEYITVQLFLDQICFSCFLNQIVFKPEPQICPEPEPGFVPLTSPTVTFTFKQSTSQCEQRRAATCPGLGVLILLLRIQRYIWGITKWGFTKTKLFPASRFSTQHSQQKVIFFCIDGGWFCSIRLHQKMLMSWTLQLTLAIFRATVDREPKIRTAEENLIYYPKNNCFCLYNKLQII